MDTLTVLGLVAVLVIGLVVVVVLRRRDRQRQAAALAAAQAETAALRAELAALEERLTVRSAPGAEFVITRAGEEAPVEPEPPLQGRVVLSAALAEPMLKTAALLHGVRRAAQPDVRNKILFEMRREVRRARKERRRVQKAVLRQMRAERRARVDDGVEADAA